MNNVDFAVHRFFPIPLLESLKLEFRAELFNLFNRPEFGIPSVTLDLPQTGQITVTSRLDQILNSCPILPMATRSGLDPAAA